MAEVNGADEPVRADAGVPPGTEAASEPESAGAEAPAGDGAPAELAPPRLRLGAIVEGRVSAVSADHALVDVGGKADGLLAAVDAVLQEGESPTDALHVGQEILVCIVGFDPDSGAPRLSQRRAAAAAAWRRIEAAFRDKEPVEGPVREAVKGGLVLDLGLRGFMPASQVEVRPVSDLSVYVGRTLQALVVECERSRNTVILSRRALLGEERRSRRDSLWSELEEGQVRRGQVKALTDFGAFVDLGGVDGLLHVSALSWGRTEKPADMLAVGQEIEVKILHLDRERDRVSLGLKQLGPDPWAGIAERYPVGGIVSGRVARLTAFGAFVELEPGVDGLVHVSQLSDERVRDPREVVAPGQTVAVKVLRVVPEERRISLSLREASEGPQRGGEGQRHAGPQDAVTLGDVLGDLRGRLAARPGPEDSDDRGSPGSASPSE
jgi:4-hydroxy-3-methylbut-2-enyl diphosphate reductase